MKRFIFLCMSVIIAFNIIAQEGKMLTMENAILDRYRKYNPESIQQHTWRGEINFYTYVEDSILFQESIKAGAKEEVLKLSELNQALNLIGESALQRFPRFEWLNKNEFEFYIQNRIFIYSFETKGITLKVLYDESAENVEFSTSNTKLAYTLKNNLFVQNENGDRLNITQDENPENVYGQAVSRSEFGIYKGTFWSPDDSKLAFYRKDESRVSDYPLVNVMARVAELHTIKYPMAGMDSEFVTLGVYDFKTKETVYLKTNPESEEYLTNVTWGAKSKYIYIAVINRAQNHMMLNKYDAASGDFIKTLFEEKNERYVEPENTLYFLNLKPNQFVWQSRRDGFNHLYLYNTEGDLIKQITSGDWLVTSLLGFDSKEKNVFVIGTKDSPLDRHLYKINVSNGKLKKLTLSEGVHNIQLSKDKNYFLDNYSSLNVPRKIELASSKPKLIRTLLDAKDPFAEFNLGEVKLGSLKTSDGKTDLYYRMILPPNFDASKKYPVIVYVYGGPHAQLVTNGWMGSARMWQHYMAQRGYIAFTLDNRGSSNRGFEFESIIHRKLGDYEIDDQMTGVDFLKSLSYVDADRIGVHGWSYGGFMTTSLMLRKAKTFKVGVAGGPVIDWKYYEVMYGERYMDTPEENPEGYEKSDLTGYVKNLEGRLMIIHGAQDPTVVWQNSLVFTRECVKQGVLIDYFPYPTHEHNVRGEDRVHLMNKVTQYFEDFL